MLRLRNVAHVGVALILLAAAGVVRGSAQTRDSIAGRVVGDDGLPVVNARVQVSAVRGEGPQRVSLQALSDDEGNFRIAGLRPGDYAISANAEAYLPGWFAGAGLPGDNRLAHPGDFINLTLRKGAVITGKVTDAKGQPVVAVFVGAMPVRNQNDQPVPPRGIRVEREAQTDDRGVYRIYGLQSGSYLVVANGRLQFYPTSAYSSDAPTYYPSATREEAAAVSVRSGQEVSEIDIRYKGERGYSIRGTVTGASQPGDHPSVTLTRTNGADMRYGGIREEDGAFRFVFNGIPDGDYELVADRQSSPTSESVVSERRIVSVAGDDVTGVELRLNPTASIAGHVVITKPPNEEQPRCWPVPASAVAQASIDAYLTRDGKVARQARQSARTDSRGNFEVRNLEPGRYHFQVQISYPYLYLSAISLPAATPQQKPVDVGEGVVVKPGDRLSELTATVTNGAASMSGKVLAPDGTTLPAGLRVYLIPAEREQANNLLRFAESLVRTDGTFLVNRIAPGRYLVVTDTPPERESLEPNSELSAWDNQYRAMLRRDSEAQKVSVTLEPCQQLSRYEVQYVPQKTPILRSPDHAARTRDRGQRSTGPSNPNALDERRRQKKALGSIAGTVAIAGKPASGIAVTLMPLRASQYELALNTTADDEGRFRFSNLAAGRYVIKPEAPAMVIQDTFDYSNRGKVVTLAEDESVAGLDLNLGVGGVITGRVTTAGGVPVIAEEITPMLVSDRGQKHLPLSNLSSPDDRFRLRTDDRGIYRLYGLPPGRYLISAARQRAGRTRYSETFHPGVTEESLARLVQLEEGGEVFEADITMRHPPQVYEASGRLIDEATQQPISGVRMAYGKTNEIRWAPETGANGVFHVKDLPPGSYFITIASDGGSEYTSDEATFDITDRDVSGIEIRARRAASISGTILVDGAGNPSGYGSLSDLKLVAVKVSGGLGVPAKVEPDGRFRIPGLPPDKYKFWFIGSSTGRKEFSFLRVERNGAPQPNAVDVGNGEQVSGLRVVLAYGTGQIKGRVQVVGAELPPGWQIMSLYARRISQPDSEDIHRGELDSRGTFVIYGLPAGEYRVSVDVVLPSSADRPRPIHRSFSQTASVTDGGETQVTLPINFNAPGK